MIHQSCRSASNSIKNDDVTVPCTNILGNPNDQADEGNGEECEIPEELARLLKQEEKMMLTHQEAIEVINLGTDAVKKEVKIGVAL